MELEIFVCPLTSNPGTPFNRQCFVQITGIGISALLFTTRTFKLTNRTAFRIHDLQTVGVYTG